jgi:mono/diheme cytochrome c family protein
VTPKSPGAKLIDTKFTQYLDVVMSDNNLDQHNKAGLWAFLVSVIFCTVFFVYISFVHKGVDLKEIPEVDPAAAQGPNLASIAKPWEENADLVAHGAKIYALNCVSCHGETGAGDGVAGAALNPKPRDLIEGKWRKGGQSHELYATLLNGIEGGSMASFSYLPKTDRWALVQYIRSITKNKVADDAAAVEKYSATAK